MTILDFGAKSSALRNGGSGWFSYVFLMMLTVVGASPADAEEAVACKPTPVEAYESMLATAEAAVRKAPATALEKLDQAEAMLPCLTGPVSAESLGSLFRLRAVAYQLQKKRDDAREAFLRTAALYPGVNCQKSLAGYGAASVVRDLEVLCNAAVSVSEELMRPVRLTELKEAAGFWLDGASRTSSDGAVTVDLVPGPHFVQVKHSEGFGSRWVRIKRPEEEVARIQVIDIRELGLLPVKEEVVQTGTLQLEGLEPGTEITLDGRTRRDLPTLRNVEVGDRHLLIRGPDGNVMGATVNVKAGQTTVYTVELVAVDLGGPSVGLTKKKLVGVGSLGLAVLSAVGSGLTFGLAGGRYAEADAHFQEYSALTTGTVDAFAVPYEDAVSAQSAGNTFQTMGWVMGGVAAAAAGAGTYFLFFSGSGDEFAGFQPYLVPLLGEESEAGGVAMGVKGRF